MVARESRHSCRSRLSEMPEILGPKVAVAAERKPICGCCKTKQRPARPSRGRLAARAIANINPRDRLRRALMQLLRFVALLPKAPTKHRSAHVCGTKHTIITHHLSGRALVGIQSRLTFVI